MANSTDRDVLEFLIASNIELRDELKMRVRQRDAFGIQFIIATGALLSIIMTSNSQYSPWLVFLIPVITTFYSIQIMSSYSVHERLSYFIREKIEKEIAHQLDKEDRMDLFWENYCEFDRSIHKAKLPGIRKAFFIKAMFIVPLLSIFIFCGKIIDQYGTASVRNIFLSLILTFFFEVLSYYVYYSFEKKPLKIELNSLSQIDYFNKRKVNHQYDKAVFFDRDGTIHVDKVMTREKNQLKFFEDTVSTIKTFQERKYRIIIITNQSGIGKGIYSTRKMHKFNKYMIRQLNKQGCIIDAIYYCPHKKDDDCKCHKPNTGMIERAIKEFNIDVNKSILIGDKMTDIKAGVSAGIRSNFIVTTGIYDNNDFNTEPYLEELQGKFKTISHLSDVLSL